MSEAVTIYTLYNNFNDNKMRDCFALSVSYLFIYVAWGLSSKIPQHLIKCYSVEYESQKVHYPPFDVRTLVELIRKVEHNRSEPNIRLISSAILHDVKFDGVQHASPTTRSKATISALPFRASGDQFYKHSYIIDHLTPHHLENDTLTDDDFCLLHFLISDTLDLRIRGDEHKTCLEKIGAYKKPEGLKDTSQMSDCPELKGVIDTDWGTVSVGPLIAGIAAAFEQSEKRNNSRVDLVWMATLGGVLSQVVSNQAAEKFRFNAPGYWNDSLKPGKFYLSGNFWDSNDPLILGAIDGLILSFKVRNWYHEYPATALSHLIASYYSPRGIPYDPSICACNRAEKLIQLYDKYDFLEEVSKVLCELNKVGTYYNSLDDVKINGLASRVVNEFKSSLGSMVSKYNKCPEGKPLENQKRLEIIMIVDQTYTQYEMEEILALLDNKVDVSVYSSRIGVISGSSSRWLVSITNEVTDIYKTMTKIKRNEWPTGLILSSCLHTVIVHYQNVSGTQKSHFERPHGKVIVVLGKSSYLTDDDLATSRRSLDSIRRTYPETRVILVTDKQGARTFDGLAAPGDRQTFFISGLKFLPAITKHLNDIPASIIDVYRNSSVAYFEDYLTPNMTMDYEIAEKYMTLTNIAVNIRSRHAITACAHGMTTTSESTSPASRRRQQQCRSLRGGDEITFLARDHCPNQDSTAPCSLRVALQTSNTQTTCAEQACRYPDQVLINIRTSWTRSASKASPTRQSTSWLMLFMALLFIVSFYKKQMTN